MLDTFCDWQPVKWSSFYSSRRELSNQIPIPTNIWLQKSASIQPRTGPLKLPALRVQIPQVLSAYRRYPFCYLKLRDTDWKRKTLCSLWNNAAKRLLYSTVQVTVMVSRPSSVMIEVSIDWLRLAVIVLTFGIVVHAERKHLRDLELPMKRSLFAGSI